MRTFHLLLTLLAAGTLLAGCYKQPGPTPEGPEAGQTLTLKAIVEGGVQTKMDVATTTGVPTWTTGDQVKYCISNGATTQYNTSTVDISAGEISVTIPAGYNRTGYAIYPPSAVPASPTATDYTTPRVVYASSYDIAGRTAETWSPCPMVADNTATDLDFYHVGGLLRLHVANIPSGTRSLRVLFKGMTYMTGTFSVANAGTTTATCSKYGTDGGNTVTFTNGGSDFGTSTYLNVPIPGMDCSALKEILVYCLDSSGAMLCVMSKFMTWGTYARAAGRTASYDGTDRTVVFSVSADTPVHFSPGNLQAHISSGPTNTHNYAADEWRFAANQWDFCFNTLAVGNWVDHFSWVGRTATWNTYGLCTSTDYNETAGDAYHGTSGSDILKTDWGSIPGVIAAVGTGWRTLTNDEWNYLFKTRQTGATVNGTANARYMQAIIRADATGVKGVILFPDGYAGTPTGVTQWGAINASATWTNCTQISTAGWNALANAGCVFLPAAGYRNGASVYDNTWGCYWTATPFAANIGKARYAIFNNDGVVPMHTFDRLRGACVRLVR